MSLDKILEKEQRLNNLKKWLEEFKKESVSADDDKPIVQDDKEKAKIKETEEIIQKSEKRINELKAAEGWDSESNDDSTMTKDEFDKVLDQMESIVNKHKDFVLAWNDKLDSNSNIA